MLLVKKLTFLTLGLVLLSCQLAPAQEKLTGPRFALTFTKEVSDKPFTGRVLVMFGKSGEPRRGPNWFGPQPFFAKDVKDWKPGQELIVGADMLGFPKKLDEIPAGEFTVQAVLDLDPGSHRIGEGPGNGYSKSIRINHDPKKDNVQAIIIDQIVQERPFPDSDRIKLVEVESKLLTKFHGKPIKLRAGLLLPADFETDKNKRYPVVYEIPGFGGDHRGILGRSQRRGSNIGGIEMIYVVLDPDCRTGHQVFADSANNGPYGQALIEELIPEIEKRYRGIGKPTARFLTGHSSGGWSSLWLQVTYPDFFGGTWSTAPDPVDFRDFQRINLYEPGTNMFIDDKGASRPLARFGDRVMVYYKAFSDMEHVLGRGGQLQSFEAVFSPKDGNGQPRQLWDRQSGAIDTEVAKYWEKYDIRLVLERNWATLGPKLKGKIHVFMGDKDTFYLEGATILLKESLAKLGSDAVVEIHPGKDHGSLLSGDLIKRIGAEMAATFKKHHTP